MPSSPLNWSTSVRNTSFPYDVVGGWVDLDSTTKIPVPTTWTDAPVDGETDGIGVDRWKCRLRLQIGRFMWEICGNLQFSDKNHLFDIFVGGFRSNGPQIWDLRPILRLGDSFIELATSRSKVSHFDHISLNFGLNARGVLREIFSLLWYLPLT